MSEDEKIVGVIESAQLTLGIFNAAKALKTMWWAIYFTDRRMIVARTITTAQEIGRNVAIGGGSVAAGAILGNLLGGNKGEVVGAVLGGMAGNVETYKTELDTQKEKINNQMSGNPDDIMKADPNNFEVSYSDVKAIYMMHNPAAMVTMIKMMMKVVTVSGKKYSFVIEPNSLRNWISSEKIEYNAYTELLKPLLGDKLKVNQWKNF